MKILALGLTLASVCIGSAYAQPAPEAVERAALRVATVVADTELIPAARGTVRNPPPGAPVELSACLSSLPSKEVVAKIAYPIADDFTADELVALARFIDTPEGQRIAQARASRLAAGQIVFALPEQDAIAVRKALPEALARKWSSGAVTQPHVVRAMRTVLEERHAYCRNTVGKVGP
ncbi:hypothetical protein [Cupriavidus plantarum]|uniref:DUF2059 domain-containing protein n=1 Tax=Cupriavidus plantarum TaxID=942865 RepID=A0A316FA77_9BURK|nr:hypothetical protein [Cupriavidus plantarum]PWK34144.1 hypothetical protein C7419_103463 [Cupriavidus plantarum]